MLADFLKSYRKFNWFQILLGALLGYISFSTTFTEIESSELEALTISLKNEIDILTGRKKDHAARFYSNEYRSRFVISEGAGIAVKDKALEMLKPNDTLRVQVKKSDLVSLDDKMAKIKVHTIQVKDKTILSLDKMNLESGLYSKRLKFFVRFLALMFIINGFKLISRKTNYIIIVIFVVWVFVMRIFRLWIYS